MKRVKTLTGNKTYGTTMCKGGCGECQTSCQSACKTSCTVGNQTCESNKELESTTGRMLPDICLKQGELSFLSVHLISCMEKYVCRDYFIVS